MSNNSDFSETQILHLEQITVTKEAFSAITDGAQVMKEIHGHMCVTCLLTFQIVDFDWRCFRTIDDVENTMQDIQEQMDIANEMSDAISKPVGFGVDFDDDELQAELDELAQQQVDESLMGVKGMPATPAVVPAVSTAAAAAPASAAPARSADEDEFRRLEQEMAI